MMIRSGTTALFLAAMSVGCASSARAQQTPRDWKQGVEYRVEATLDEGAGTLAARARVRYRNDSPDTLDAFYFHLYLNAFRPNSAWARRDLEFGIRTFQDLGPEEHGFERIRDLTVDGQPVRLRYPFAPDSTIVGFDLPEPLPPGGVLSVDVRWDARPSTVPRRQGRRGRHFDFAQWYPRVVVYDDEGWRVHPLFRAGELYGEFATYDVTFDVRSDQVIGATGVPVEGDPGWEGAAALGTGPIDHQREWYGSVSGPPCVERGGERVCDEFPARRLRAAESLGFLTGAPASGRKRVRWIAEDVHHFAWSTSPDYVFEQGLWNGIAIRVLYRPGDEASWGAGNAVRRTIVALQWLDSIFGPYPYPQVTNVHRLEGGGTEFPMMVMNGSASQSLILHEVGHIYAYGILANNEWYEGWLDEGMTSFQTAWYFERHGGGPAQWEGPRRSTLLNDVRGISEPVVLAAEKYAEQGVYSAMIYRKGSVILWMLREMAGEAAMVRILRTYYQRYRFRHVDSEAFQDVAEEVMGRDLDWFFGAWLHGTGVVDYALGDVDVRAGNAGGWRTTFELERRGEIRMPVPVRLRGEGQELDTIVDGSALEASASVLTSFRPDEVKLDPDGTILDWNPANNGWGRGLADPAFDLGWDDPLRPQAVRLDAVPVGVFPLAWVNDAGGWVAGLQVRTSLLGLHTTTLRLGLPAITAGHRGPPGRSADPGSIYLRSVAPVVGGRPRAGTRAEVFLGEGRGFGRLDLARVTRDPPLSGAERAVGVFATGSWVYDDAYLVPARWSPGRRLAAEAGISGRAGAALTGRGRAGGGGVTWSARADGAVGFDTRAHRWVRGTLALDGRRSLGASSDVRTRLFIGGALGSEGTDGGGSWTGDRVPAERRVYLSNADPWQSVGNPWLRSAGAALERRGWGQGGGVLRGFDPTVSAAWVAAASVEIAGPGLRVGGPRGIEARGVAFLSGGTAGRPGLPPVHHPGEAEPGGGDPRLDAGTFLWSAGVGLELGRPGSALRLEVDLPFLVSHPELARDAQDRRAGMRVQVGFVGR